MHGPAVGTSSWWAAVMEFSESDVVYIRGGEKIAGVSDC